MNIHCYHNIHWGEEIELTVPLDIHLAPIQPVLSVTLSNGQYATFTQSQIVDRQGKSFWVDVNGNTSEPSRLLCQFDCFSANNSMMTERIENGSRSNKRLVVMLLSSSVVLIAAGVAGFMMQRNRLLGLFVVPVSIGEDNTSSGNGVPTDATFEDGLGVNISAEGHGNLECTNHIDLAVQDLLWSTTSMVVAASLGAISTLLFSIGIFFFLFGNEKYIAMFDPRKRVSMMSQRSNAAPFVAVMLGWERGMAKDAPKDLEKKGSASYPAKYGAIDPTTGLPPLPERFLIAEFGDKDKALERWGSTLR